MNKPLILTLFIVIFLSSESKSQIAIFNRNDIILYGGGTLDIVNSSEEELRKLRGDLLLGGEYFISQQISIGINLDFDISRQVNLSQKNDPFVEADYITFLIGKFYNKKLFYLKAGIGYHQKIDDSYAYPRSFQEIGYYIGTGKLIAINQHIFLDFGVQFTSLNARMIDIHGQNIFRNTLQFSFYTGVKFLTQLEKQKNENKNYY